MKTAIVLLLLSVAAAGFSQSSGPAKLYAYKQASAPGVQKGIVDEQSGTEVKSQPSGTGFSYFIYLASTARIYPSEIWIDGQPYAARVEVVAKTPIEITHDNQLTGPKKTVLVPKTSQKVVQLTPAPAIAGKSLPKAKILAKANELVVVYKAGGKFYYQSQAKMAQLESNILQ